ncbi:MAG: elongation factor 4, partial [Patescibacteria group bacterium]
SPAEHLSSVMNLKKVFDLEVLEVKTIGQNVLLQGKMPLSELIRDFDDQLKSLSQGFASFSYDLAGEEEADVEKIEILVANELVPALTRIIPKKDLEREARKSVEKLKELLPKQQFTQAIQAISGGRIIARETIPAMKKLLGNFGKTGGDRTRKMKLWKKQKRGKDRLKETGRVDVPIEVFREILKK